MSGVRGPTDEPALRSVLTIRGEGAYSRPFDAIHVSWTTSGNLRVSALADGKTYTYHYRSVREWVADMPDPGALSVLAREAAVEEARGTGLWVVVLAAVTLLIVVLGR